MLPFSGALSVILYWPRNLGLPKNHLAAPRTSSLQAYFWLVVARCRDSCIEGSTDPWSNVSSFAPSWQEFSARCCVMVVEAGECVGGLDCELRLFVNRWSYFSSFANIWLSYRHKVDITLSQCVPVLWYVFIIHVFLMHRCLKEPEFVARSDMHCGANLFGSLSSILLEDINHVHSCGFAIEKAGDD
jgi:hypothetical protein